MIASPLHSRTQGHQHLSQYTTQNGKVIEVLTSRTKNKNKLHFIHKATHILSQIHDINYKQK